MSRAVLGLGSNIGNRLAFLQSAVDGFGAAVLAVSPVYETKPWGMLNQNDFLNAVIIVADDAINHWGWLRRAQELERAAGRTRRQHWGPRTLDVDLITVTGVTSTNPELMLPHPGAAMRATVLAPWLDIEPNAELPGYGNISALLARQSLAGISRRDDLTLVIRSQHAE